MQFNQYQQAARKTAVYPAEAKIVYPALGLANEAGEAAGVIKKAIRDGTPEPVVRERLKAECGDVLWYLAILLDDAGITMEECAEYNLKKLSDRQDRGVIQGSGDER